VRAVNYPGEPWLDAYDSELEMAVEELKAAGKRPYVNAMEGEDEDGAPTHWYAEDPETGEALSPRFDVHDFTWEDENPSYFNLYSLQEEVQDRVVAEWHRRNPD